MTKIPAQNAELFYITQPGEMPTEFVAADRVARFTDRKAGRPDFTDRFSHSNGCHVDGWMARPSQTPAGVFAGAYLSRLPAEQIELMLIGLHEIARIEGQEWAEQMLALLETPPKPWKANK